MDSPSDSARRPRKRPKEARKPREILRRDERNIRLHLPRVDYNDIAVGAKREFRNYGTRYFDGLIFPTPAVGYCQRDWWTPEHGLDGIDTCLLTLEDSWVEPLGAIAPESIANEGFADLGEFRRYFAERYPRGGFRPLASVIVYRVHPITPEDVAAFSEARWQKFYGQYG